MTPKLSAAVITVHAEATRHLHRTMAEMTALAGPEQKFLRGVAINPGTRPRWPAGAPTSW
ncbi:MAG: hypothetical protein ABSB59_05430 [Streptosporangiaceae bacterium]